VHGHIRSHLMQMLSVYYFKGHSPFETHVFVLQLLLCFKCFAKYAFVCWIMSSTYVFWHGYWLGGLGFFFFRGEFCQLVEKKLEIFEIFENSIFD
jgi:hypothetical protein